MKASGDENDMGLGGLLGMQEGSCSGGSSVGQVNVHPVVRVVSPTRLIH